MNHSFFGFLLRWSSFIHVSIIFYSSLFNPVKKKCCLAKRNLLPLDAYLYPSNCIYLLHCVFSLIVKMSLPCHYLHNTISMTSSAIPFYRFLKDDMKNSIGRCKQCNYRMLEAETASCSLPAC